MRALIGALLIGGCAVLTASRLPQWRSDGALWLAAHRQSPTLPRPMLNLGAVALREGRITDAEAWWQQAESSGRLTTGQQRALRRMRCFAALTSGDPSSSVEGCF